MTFELDITQFTANKQHNGTYTKSCYFLDIHIVSIVNLVSAWKLKCPSLARLGSEPS